MNTTRTTTRTFAAAAILASGIAAAPAFADDAGVRPAERLLEQVSGNVTGQAAGDSRYEERRMGDVDTNLNRSERFWRELARKSGASN